MEFVSYDRFCILNQGNQLKVAKYIFTGVFLKKIVSLHSFLYWFVESNGILLLKSCYFKSVKEVQSYGLPFLFKNIFTLLL